MTPEEAAALREPFPASMVGKLPRVTCRDCSDKNTNCTKHQKSKCSVCGAYISSAHIHLDFVGHATATDRLLKVDPEWNWEPLALSDDGCPVIRRQGSMASMWIKLTICGVTRICVGTAPSGKDELEKELISDAIRNGAMRFGVALDLWSKEDLLAPEGVDASTGEIAGGASTRKAEDEGGAPDASARPTLDTTPPAPCAKQATAKQRGLIERLVNKTGLVPTPWPLPPEGEFPMSVASKMIDWLQDQPVEPPAERVGTLRKDSDAAQQEFVG